MSYIYIIKNTVKAIEYCKNNNIKGYDKLNR